MSFLLIQSPARLDDVKERLRDTDTELNSKRIESKNAKTEFEKVKRQRLNEFNTCFEAVAQRVDSIYKSLTNNASAQAFLVPENPEEPYLEGINYNCVAPGKRFQPMSNLSGGERQWPHWRSFSPSTHTNRRLSLCWMRSMPHWTTRTSERCVPSLQYN